MFLGKYVEIFTSPKPKGWLAVWVKLKNKSLPDVGRQGMIHVLLLAFFGVNGRFHFVYANAKGSSCKFN